MRASGSHLRIVEAPAPGTVPADVDAFLRGLRGPTLIRQPGRDRKRARVAAALIHGDEPSGARAVHAWLRSGAVPATDALLLVASVRAALAPPGFACRALPGARDLNRCFLPPFEAEEGALAAEILEQLRAAAPEALIDLHNNSGHNPSYGVGPRAGPNELALAGLFGERFVHSPLRLGALVEACAGEFPSVTVECGRAGDPGADAVAARGLERFLSLDRIAPEERPARRMQVLRDPVRVTLRAGVRLAFGESPRPGFDLTVHADVDRHNFERLAAGTAIGWLGAPEAWPLEARGASGDERSRELFTARAGRLETRRPIIPVMMTTDARSAEADCLFYIVREA